MGTRHCCVRSALSLFFNLVLMELAVAAIVACLPVASKHTYMPMRIVASLLIIFLGGEMPTTFGEPG